MTIFQKLVLKMLLAIVRGVGAPLSYHGLKNEVNEELNKPTLPKPTAQGDSGNG